MSLKEIRGAFRHPFAHVQIMGLIRSQTVPERFPLRFPFRCGCDDKFDIPVLSSLAQISGTLIRPAREADAVQKSHSRRRPASARASQTVV